MRPTPTIAPAMIPIVCESIVVVDDELSAVPSVGALVAVVDTEVEVKVVGTWISEQSATIASPLNVVQGLPKLLKPATSSHDARLRHRVSTTELELEE